jgi:ribonuclease HI
MKEEDGYHAVMECTTARALRYEMRQLWDLPSEEEMSRSGKDWVLILLDKLNEKSRAMVMFLWWRAWHHRNDQIFGKGDASVKHSARYLDNYLNTVFRLDGGQTETDRKGKQPMYSQKTNEARKEYKDVQHLWIPPKTGEVKVNVDACFSENSMEGSWGAVARNCKGDIIFSAWDLIHQASSAECCEALACLEGLKLAIQHSHGNILIETDCLSLLKTFDPGGEDRSEASVVGREFNLLIPDGRKVTMTHVKREANSLAHALAKFSSMRQCMGVLYGLVPTCASEFCERDCMNLVTEN